MSRFMLEMDLYSQGFFFCTKVNSKDFGIVLKMAQLIKDGSTREQKSIPETLKRPQTIIIPAREFVQIIAKNVPLSSDEFSNSNARDRRKDFMIDSVISRSNIVDVERELERWTPDVDDPECPELDNIFDGTWNRNWGSVETNETLFGVKSTFNEEFYTTKLERGPQTRDREREASRIAREIEGEESHDLHIAEERGFKLLEGFDIDEESRYSAVRRQTDDGRFEENDGPFSDDYNVETFGASIGSEIPIIHPNISRGKKFGEGLTSSTHATVDEDLTCSTDKVAFGFSSNKRGSSSTSDDTSTSSHMHANKATQDLIESKFLNENSSKVSVDAHIPMGEDDKVLVDKKRLPSPSDAPSVSAKTDNHGQSSEHVNSSKMHSSAETVDQYPVTPTSIKSEFVSAGSVSSGPSLSPSSSMGSLSSEKSTLNPNAKEFKLNPNAKSFTPSTFRPSVPMSEGSFYYTGTVPAVPAMQNLPMGVGVGPPFGTHQPVYNPQAPQLQPPQPYIHANGHMLPYGQQMIVGQPRPFYYVPTYPSKND
ncbi:hypothetical protein HPP92_023492 [Vanilla planifolia]|uniref:LsmAD domain-containing protein n=1 Tax=Vanilla planifolia TaxID=51239 RepID=A0A835PLW1_VANPL|nr:hypothetical protein HPP92_023492 [Vanilla planifolia]